MSPMMPWYFAHPVSDYDTCFEQVMVENLERYRMIENPNQPRHQKGYLLKGMDHFLEDVLPSCFGCIFLALPGGYISAGVATEVEYFLDRKMPVFEATRLYVPLIPVARLEERRILTVPETRAALKVLKTMGNGGRYYV